MSKSTGCVESNDVSIFSDRPVLVVLSNSNVEMSVTFVPCVIFARQSRPDDAKNVG